MVGGEEAVAAPPSGWGRQQEPLPTKLGEGSFVHRGWSVDGEVAGGVDNGRGR